MLLLGAGDGWSKTERPPFVVGGFEAAKMDDEEGFAFSDGDASLEVPLAMFSNIDLVAEAFWLAGAAFWSLLG